MGDESVVEAGRRRLAAERTSAQQPLVDAAALQSLVDQIEQIGTQIAFADAVKAILTQVTVLQHAVEQLMILCQAERVKIPVRDEFNRIVEVREQLVMPTHVV